MSFIYDEIEFHFYNLCEEGDVLGAEKILSSHKETITNYIKNGDGLEIYMACSNGNIDVVHFLIKNFGLNEKVINELPQYLFNAVENNHLSIVKYLSGFIKIYSDVISEESVTKYSKQALHTCSKEGYVEIMDYLIHNFFQTYNMTNLLEENFLTAIHHYKNEVTDYLIDNYNFVVNQDLKNMLTKYSREDLLKKILSKKMRVSLEQKLSKKYIENNSQKTRGKI